MPKPQVVADWNEDGKDDSKGEAAEWYSQGQRDFFDALRARWPDHIIIANITRWAWDDIPDRYRNLVQGGIMEGLMGLSYSPSTWGGWDRMMQAYRDYMALIVEPRLGFFHVVGAADDYQFMRYSLTSCLMDDGYYSHTTSDGYGDIAWFDEWDLDLGDAIDPPQLSPWKNGVYRRRFTKGMAIVNPMGNGDQTIEIEAGYSRFRGKQDPSHNNGEPVSKLVLRQGDGIILISEGTNQVSKPNPPVIF
jgi:hypothetical protein